METMTTSPETVASPPQVVHKNVVTLSELARTKIRAFADSMPEAKDKSFRIFIEAGGCSGFQYGYMFDDIHDGDHISTFDDIKILVDPKSLTYIAGSELDYIEDFRGAGFNVKNPQAKAACGCGTSFNV